MSKLIKVFVVDDHPVVNRGLTTLLDDPAKQMQVVGHAFTGEEALAKLKRLQPDIILMDIRLPDMDGIETSRRVKVLNPRIKIIMLTTFNDREYIKEAIGVGAEGFLLKEASEDMIIRTINSVHEGNIVISTQSDAPFDHDSGVIETAPVPAPDKDLLDRLSQREQEIFMLLIHGKDNREIAETLFISEHTVRNYVSKIYTALNVKNRTAAVLWAQERGIS